MPNTEIAPITESDIKYILEKEDLEEYLRNEERKKLELLKSANETMEEVHDEIISAVSLKGKVMEQDVLTPTRTHREPLLDILEKSESIKKEYYRGLHLNLNKTLDHIETVQRVKMSFESLNRESKEIIDLLHIKKEKWEYVEHHIGISHAALVKKNRFALDLLLSRCNSNLTISELARMRMLTDEQDRTPQNKRREKNMKGQLSLFSEK